LCPDKIDGPVKPHKVGDACRIDIERSRVPKSKD
jgi:hypothetical protein